MKIKLRDRVPLGVPLLQLLFAVTLDFLQIFKSETVKPLIERGDIDFTDVPYEAAIVRVPVFCLSRKIQGSS